MAHIESWRILGPSWDELYRQTRADIDKVIQPSLDFNPPVAPVPQIGGDTYVPSLDGERLHRLLDRVRGLMLDGRWRTLYEIQLWTAGTEASISARLRDLRKAGLRVDKRRRGNAKAGLFEYRVGLK